MKDCSLQTNCNQPNFLLSRVHTCSSNWRDVINKGRDGYQLKQARLNHINPEQVKGFNFQNNFGLNAFEMGRLLHWGSSWSNLSFIVRPELSSPYRNKEAWQFSGCNQNCWDKGNCKKLKGPITIPRRPTVSRLYVINQLSLSGWGGMHSLRRCPRPLSPRQLLQEAVRSHSFGRLEKGWSLSTTVEGILHTLLHRHGGCADPDMDRGAGQAPTEKGCWSIWWSEGAKLLRTGLPQGDLIFLSNYLNDFLCN